MMSTGDEAGSAGGVVSSKIKGKAEFVLFSFDVKFEGKERDPCLRHHVAQRQEHRRPSPCCRLPSSPCQTWTRWKCIICDEDL